MSDQLYSSIDESNYVLAPTLYNVLRENFPGGVIIANQGEHCYMSSSRQTDGRLYTSINHSGEYYRVNCPFCQDTRHRLWVNHMFGQQDANGRPMRFLATCYNEQCLEDWQNRKRFNDVVYGFRNANERHRTHFELNNPNTWIDPNEAARFEPPGQVIPLTQMACSIPDHPAVRYMCGERRYTTQMLQHYEVGYCTYAPRFPEAADRIIFPIKMYGNAVGWQARYIGTTDWRQRAKYYGMPGMRKRMILYNYDNARNMPFVCLVEGVTDCHVIGDYACALLGKSLSRYQMELVLMTWGGTKPIIMILDPDAREEMRSTVLDLRNSGAIVVEVLLPGEHDCGDYDRRTLLNIIYSQARQMGVILPAVA